MAEMTLVSMSMKISSCRARSARLAHGQPVSRTVSWSRARSARLAHGQLVSRTVIPPTVETVGVCDHRVAETPSWEADTRE